MNRKKLGQTKKTRQFIVFVTDRLSRKDVFKVIDASSPAEARRIAKDEYGDNYMIGGVAYK